MQKNTTFRATSEAQFHLATDASNTGTGGMLFQMEGESTGVSRDDSDWIAVRIIIQMLFKLTESERRYSMPEKKSYSEPCKVSGG